MGSHFESPKRCQPWRRDSEVVIWPGLALEVDDLLTQINKIWKLHKPELTSVSQPTDDGSNSSDHNECPTHPSDDFSSDLSHNGMSPGAGNLPSDEMPSQRILPDAAAYRLYSNWLVLIPTLVHSYLGYIQKSQGRLGRPLGVVTKLCQSGFCVSKEFEIQCLHFDCMSFYIDLRVSAHFGRHHHDHI